MTKCNSAGGSWFRTCCWGRTELPPQPRTWESQAGGPQILLPIALKKHCCLKSCCVIQLSLLNTLFKNFPSHGMLFFSCWVSIQSIWALGLFFFFKCTASSKHYTESTTIKARADGCREMKTSWLTGLASELGPGAQLCPSLLMQRTPGHSGALQASRLQKWTNIHQATLLSPLRD